MELNKALPYRNLTELEAIVHEAGSKRMKVLEKNPKTKPILDDMLKKAKNYLLEVANKKVVVSVAQASNDVIEDLVGKD